MVFQSSSPIIRQQSYSFKPSLLAPFQTNRTRAVDSGTKNCQSLRVVPRGTGAEVKKPVIVEFSSRDRLARGKSPGCRAEGMPSLALALGLSALVLPSTIRAQDLVKDALQSFPRETIRLEYSNPAKLRTLPNYAKLRQRYVGLWLEKLEASLAQIGIREDDVNELVLGWQAGTQELGLYGLATGRFSSKATADRAAAVGLTPTPVAGLPAYCLEAGLVATCVAVLGESRGAFGKLVQLGTMLEALSGQAVGLSSDVRFTQLVDQARTSAPIWGVAIGPAVADWFRGWMPGQGNVQLDWSRVFQPVESLIYTVEPGDKVRMDLKLNCEGPEAAASLRQVLEGLKVAQLLTWQSQNPNRPNPFEGLEVELSGRQVFVRLATDYSSLEGIGAPGKPGVP